MAILAISGPRAGSLYGYDRKNYKQLEDKLLDCILRVCDEDSTVIVSSEQGAGQTAYAAAVRARFTNPSLKVHIYQAFPGEQAAWSKTGDFGQEDYIRMCENADYVRDCSKTTTHRTEDAKRNSISSAKHTRAHLMAEQANGVLVVSDFVSPKQLEGVPGEIPHLMRKALETKTCLWAMDPKTLKITSIYDPLDPPSAENQSAMSGV